MRVIFATLLLLAPAGALVDATGVGIHLRFAIARASPGGIPPLRDRAPEAYAHPGGALNLMPRRAMWGT